MAKGDVDLYQAFNSGYYPLFISGPWSIKELQTKFPKLKGKWGVSVLPKRKTPTSFIGGCNLVMFKKSKNKEAAWKFIEFMNSKKIQVEWFNITTDLPSNKYAWEDPVIKNDDKLVVFGEQLLHVKSPPNIPEWEQLANALQNNLERFIYGKVELESMLNSTTNEFNYILNKSKKKQPIGVKLTILILLITIFVIILIVYFKKKPKKDIALIRGKTQNIPWIFVAPAVVILFIFLFIPIVASFIMSLTDWDIYSISDWGKITFIGFKNYSDLLKDNVFWISLRNTFIFAVVGVPLTVFIALLAAILLNQQIIKLKAFFRVGYFIPVVTTLVAVAVIWRWMYNPKFGLINNFLELIGLQGQEWLANPWLALPSLIVMAIWRNFGYSMVIFLAGLQAIPDYLYESAGIDGANKFQKFRHITVPMLAPTTFFICIITTIGYFQFFAEPYIMTDGGPLNNTMSVVLYMYNNGFKFYNMGYASSIAYILFALICVFTLFQVRLAKKINV